MDVIAAFILNRANCSPERIWDQVFSYCNFFGHAGGGDAGSFRRRYCPLGSAGTEDWRANLSTARWPTKRHDSHLQLLCRYGDLPRPGRFHESAWCFGQGLTRAGYKGHEGMALGPICAEIGGNGNFRTGWVLIHGTFRSFLSLRDLDAGLSVVKEIRDAVGRDIEILIEGHSRWDLNCAIKIARALEPYDVLWMEDMMKPESAADLSRLAAETRVPHSVSERLFTRYAYRQVLEARAAHIIMRTWSGPAESQKDIKSLSLLTRSISRLRPTIAPDS